jgi:predicted ribosomally synthesized peptide with SipW-like signal peptide
MRRTTACALGGVLVGTVLLGVDGTLATLSDTESVSVTAGAGRLALTDPTPEAQQRTLAVGATSAPLPVHPEVVGSGTARLRLWAEDTHGQDPCETDLVLTVTLAQPAAPVTAGLCTLAQEGADVLLLDAATAPDVALAVTAAVTPDAGPRAGQWTGTLRVTLDQTTQQGFSDEQLVPVHIVVPNPQGNGKGVGTPTAGRPD